MTQYQLRLVDSLQKVLPNAAPRAAKKQEMIVWPGETVSFQIAGRALHDATGNGEALSVQFSGRLARRIRARRVALQPVLLATYGGVDDNYITKTAAMLPDPLLPFGEGEAPCLTLLADQWSALWCDVTLPDNMRPGRTRITAIVSAPDGSLLRRLSLTLHVQPQKLPAQTLLHTEWFHTDCLADYYHVPVWSEEHWRIVDNFMAAASRVGINMLLTPVFTPALDTYIGGERTTTQLVDITCSNGQWHFDFKKLGRWIKLCRKNGITELEICHLFTQWGAAAAPKVVATVDGEPKRVFGWDTPAVGGAYTAFLRIFLPSLKAYLAQQNMLEHSWFHISDEPSEENMEQWNAARMSVADLLEDCHLIDALSSFSIYEKGYIRTPVVSENHIEPFAEAKVPGLWTYYCCGQHTDVPNRFLAMPSARGRMLGTLLYRYDLAGFLQWGFNFYNGVHSTCQVDPWRNADGFGTWPAGDPFLVYPAPDGSAVESIRAATIREAMQDLRLLRLAESVLGRDAMLHLLEQSWDGGMITMTHYPTGSDWFSTLRTQLAQAMAAAK